MFDIFKRSRQERIVKLNIKKSMKREGFIPIPRENGRIISIDDTEVNVRFGPGIIYMTCDKLHNKDKIVKIGSTTDTIRGELWYIIAYGHKQKRHGFINSKYVY